MARTARRSIAGVWPCCRTSNRTSISNNHFDEPWDGPNNRKVLDKMPGTYRCPTEPAGSKNSSYFVLAGPGTIFDTQPAKNVPIGMGGGGMGGGPGMGGSPVGTPNRGVVPAWWPADAPTGTGFMEITDGLSNTILLVEAKRNIPWTKPEDISYAADKPLPALGGYFKGGFHVAMADGVVRFCPNTIDEKILRVLITKADRQPVSVEGCRCERLNPRSRLPGCRNSHTAEAPASIGKASSAPAETIVEGIGWKDVRVDMKKEDLLKAARQAG